MLAHCRSLHLRPNHSLLPAAKVLYGQTSRGLTVAAAAAPSAPQQSKAPAPGVFAQDKRPVVLFDGVCNLCNGAVNILLDNDHKGDFRLASLQSETGKALLQRCGRKPDDISSIVLVEEHDCHIKSDAVLKIAQKLNIPFALVAGLSMPVPSFIRDAAYDQVANNRYSIFGKTATCRNSDERYQERFIA